jgi:hypothetical protein
VTHFESSQLPRLPAEHRGPSETNEEGVSLRIDLDTFVSAERLAGKVAAHGVMMH